MIHDIIHDHDEVVSECWKWASRQGVHTIVDRHASGVTILALDPDDMSVEARASMTWGEFYTMPNSAIAGIYKRLVADANAVRSNDQFIATLHTQE
jgi:DNA/RNA-binding domain of Phe-tRNA-synthetase-like protein